RVYCLTPSPLLAGIASVVCVAWSVLRPGNPSASLCAVIGGTYAFAYMAEISLLPGGTTWGASLWAGAIIACTMLSWLMGRVLRAGLPAAVVEPYAVFMDAPSEERWTLDPD